MAAFVDAQIYFRQTNDVMHRVVFFIMSVPQDFLASFVIPKLSLEV